MSVGQPLSNHICYASLKGMKTVLQNERNRAVKKQRIKQVRTKGASKNQPIPQKDSLEQFFGRMPFLERAGPVLAEMSRILCAESGECEAGPPLPQYCHNILAIFRRTYFKHFPAFADVVTNPPGQPVQVDWRLLGKMIGIGLRCLRFGEYEVGQSSGPTPVQEKEPLRSFLGESTSEQDEMYWIEVTQKINAAFFNWNQAAFQWGPRAMAELNAGVAEGLSRFINDSGQFAGESNRAGVYWFLLLAWPEISQMQRARLPKTRSDFALWLEPFVKAGIVSIGDLDQIRDVCDDLGLKFAGRGGYHR
jgi:hypothetical protein